jgi:hypothetical protein
VVRGGALLGVAWLLKFLLVWIAQAPKRNHPLMLLSGVATNAVGFDLSPGVSELDHDDAIGVDEVPYDECTLVLCEQISCDSYEGICSLLKFMKRSAYFRHINHSSY